MIIRIILANISSHLPKQWYSLNRCVSTSVSHLHQQQKHVFEENKERWSRLYTLTEMRYLAITTKLKIYPALVTCLGTPLGFMIDTAGVFSNFHFIPSIFCIGKLKTLVYYHLFPIFTHEKSCPFSGIVTTGILSASSAAINRTIGKIDVNNKRHLKLYYIDFFGRQIIKEISTNELRNCKKSDLKFKLYKTIDTTDANGKPIQLKIATNRGDIFDTILFKKLFRNK